MRSMPDDLLRGLVFAAFDVRGTDESPAACARLVDAFVLWPLVELEVALQAVRAQLARRAETDDLVALLRSTYVGAPVE